MSWASRTFAHRSTTSIARAPRRLEPPWPDLILTVGRRPSMAALWVKAQAQGRARLVVVGRPKRWLDRFDLVIAPPQFQLPSRPNVLRLDLPLMRVDEAAVADRGRRLARPIRRPAATTGRAARRRPDQAVRVRPDGRQAPDRAMPARSPRPRAGPCTSRPAAARRLRWSRRSPQRCRPGARLYRWDAGGDNPYHALLGLADRFVVTGDSISMMVEVARLGKPLAIFALPASGRLAAAAQRPRPAPGGARGRPGGPLASLADALYRLRIAKYGRDLSEIHRRLYARGLAVPLGQPFPPPQTRPSDDLAQSGRARPAADVRPRRLTPRGRVYCRQRQACGSPETATRD